MDINHWVLFLAGLLFLQAPPSAEACRCFPSHLQQVFCKSTAALLKVTFIKASQSEPATSDNSTNINSGYEIKVLKVLTGNPELQDSTFIRSMAGSSCEYKHPKEKFNIEFLIAVSDSENSLTINLCSVKQEWSKLSPMQRQGVQGVYQRGCPCEIKICFDQPCSPTNDQCILDYSNGKTPQKQLENQICARNTEGICCWE